MNIDSDEEADFSKMDLVRTFFDGYVYKTPLTELVNRSMDNCLNNFIDNFIRPYICTYFSKGQNPSNTHQIIF